MWRRSQTPSRSKDKDKVRLQSFADTCANIDRQLVHLPGLACRNYPNALRPIVEKLPTFLQSKWEKKVTKYADDHQDAYPGFHDFASMVIAVARMKNHPNVLASGVLKEDEQKRERTPRKKPPAALVDNVDRKVLKGNLEDDAGDGEVAPTKKKYCPFHDHTGDDLAQCQTSAKKTFQEKTQGLSEARLSFHCLLGGLIAKECKANIRCDRCGSSLHQAYFTWRNTSSQQFQMNK